MDSITPDNGTSPNIVKIRNGKASIQDSDASYALEVNFEEQETFLTEFTDNSCAPTMDATSSRPTWRH